MSDEPDIADPARGRPADQVICAVYIELNAEMTGASSGSLPLGMEVKLTLWAYATDAGELDLYYKCIRLTDKGGGEIEATGTKENSWTDSMYIGRWVDCDLGDFADDLAGCDTSLDLGFGYNGQLVDRLFQCQGLHPGAPGYVLLKGPIVEETPMRLASFVAHVSGDPWQEPPGADNYQKGVPLWDKLFRGYVPQPIPDRYYSFPEGT